MAHTTYSLNTFTGGEITPRLSGRFDQDFYFSSCEEVTNFNIWQQGPLDKRPGTEYIAAAKSNDYASRLIPFSYNIEQTYIIEIADERMRFYMDGGQIYDGGSPYEIVTPWEKEDIFEIKFAQIADTMYLVHPSYPPYKLTREGHTDWTCEQLEFDGGPYLDMNTTAAQITPTAVTGTITLVASHDVWNADHVGALWKFDADRTESVTVDKDTVLPSFTDPMYHVEAGETLVVSAAGEDWEQDITVTLQKSYDNGYTWLDYTQAQTSSAVEYEVVEENVAFRFGVKAFDVSPTCSGSVTCVISLMDQWGEVMITEYNSATNVTAEVQRELPNVGAYVKWYEGAWSPYRGYPRAVVFSKQRSFFAGTIYQPQTFWGSKVDDYTDFNTRDTDDASALNFTVVSKDQNVIHNMYDCRFLMAVTAGGEWKLSDSDITPTTPAVERQSSYGSSSVQGIVLGYTILYAQRGGNRLRNLAYDFDKESWISTEVSYQSEHLFSSNVVVDMDYASRPLNIVHIVLDDGSMVACHYEPTTKFLAFTKYETEGEFESVAVIPGIYYDEVWTTTNRTINGSTARYVERFSNPLWTEQADYKYMDCSVTYSGTAKTTISGVTMLAGETCTVTVNGAVHPDVEVSEAGVVTLQSGYEGTGTVKVHIGLPYDATVKTNRLAPKTEIGGSLGKRQGVFKTNINVYNSINAKLGSSDSNLEQIKGFYYPAMGTPPTLYTGILTKTFPAGYAKEQYIQITSDTPTPLTILNITADVTASPS